MSTCCGKLFSKMGKGIAIRSDHALWPVPGSLGGFRLLWPGIAKCRRRAYGGSILRAGCKSPPAVMAVFRMSPRAPYHATWCGSADTGEIPEPTVTVRMKENGSFFCRVGRKKGRSWRPSRSAHGSRALMHIFRPVRADQGDDDASVPRYPGFFW